MINNVEKELLRNSWRLVGYFWLIIAGLGSILYSWGFLDLPATAGAVKRTEVMTIENKSSLKQMAEAIGQFGLERALRKSREADIERRLRSIERTQREQGRDTKEILRLLIQKP